jgi:predicted GNAT family acetyltransferase
MSMIVLEDRERLAAFFLRDPASHAYELGDLDDFEWPYTRWFGWQVDDHVVQVALLYAQPETPVLLALAPPVEAMRALLADIVASLPAELDVHTTASVLPTLEGRYEIVAAAAHLKLALSRHDLVADHAVPVDRLSCDALTEIKRFYGNAYPSTWFAPRMLATDRYVGVRQQGQLVCVAGVHVWSPTRSVAVLGNVATLPELRGRGLARSVCAALCQLLLADGIKTIALNVRADNLAAIRSYEKLGFEPVAEYVEARLTAR